MERTPKHTLRQAAGTQPGRYKEPALSQAETEARELAKGLLGFKKGIPDDPGSLYRFAATYQLSRGVGSARRAKFLRLIRQNIFA